MDELRARAEALYKGEGLPCPATDASQPLVALGENGFATRSLPWHLYDFPGFVAGFAEPLAQPFRAFGFAGHGLMSFAVHYYVLAEHTALAVQLRWGSAFGDAKAARARYEAFLRMADQFEAKAAAAKAAGHLAAGRRIAMAHSDFSGGRWAWIDPGAPAKWQRNDVTDVDGYLELQRLRNKPVPA